MLWSSQGSPHIDTDEQNNMMQFGPKSLLRNIPGPGTQADRMNCVFFGRKKRGNKVPQVNLWHIIEIISRFIRSRKVDGSTKPVLFNIFEQGLSRKIEN